MIRTLVALALMSLPAAAQDFSANSEAKSWNLYAEQPARFEAKVIDTLCDLTGECAADCGGGAHQLGLLRKADGVLVLPLKNGQPVFSGAANDLQPFCGKEVEVDGLMLVDADVGLNHVYQLQKIRVVGDADWTKANQWTKDWAAKNPDAAGDGPWFRRDPRINAMIVEKGYLGLGLDVDAAFIKELFP